MSTLGETWEREEMGSGRYRHVQHIAPIAFLEGGYPRRIVRDWVQGDADWPHVVTRAKLALRADGSGNRLLYPDCNRLENVAVGRPYYNAGGWKPVDLAPFTRSANLLRSVNAHYTVDIQHGGHFCKMEATFDSPSRVPDQLAFPVALSGLTWDAGVLRRTADNVVVMRMRPPVAYDAANPADVRPLSWDFPLFNGQRYVRLTNLAAAVAGMQLPTVDPTLTLQPGAAAGKDTIPNSFAPTFNYGVSVQLIWDSRKAIIEFDNSSIPVGALCLSNTLYTYQNASGPALAWTVAVYSIAIGNQAWIEGTRNGALALAGEPCWNALAANGAGGVLVPWAGTAGLSTAGVDYEGPPGMGSFSGNRSDANGTEYICALNAARSQGWFGAVNTNYGMLLVPSTIVGGLGSSDYATAAWRPKQVVEYKEPRYDGIRHGARWI